MEMEMELTDCVLVAVGLGLMVAYHLWFLYMVVKHPTKTVIGINAVNRKAWVYTMMEDPSKSGILAVQTIRNNIMASTLLASTAIMLCSLVAMLMTDSSGGGTGVRKLVIGGTAGDPYASSTGGRGQMSFSLKSLFILSCFLVAFLMNVQSIRYYNHASILINTKRSSSLTPEYVAGMVNRGSYFWSIGLRAFYFSFPLFLWIFGSVPMCMCCVALVLMLNVTDVPFHGMAAPPPCQQDDQGGDEEEEVHDFDVVVGNNVITEDTALRVRIPSSS